MANTAESQGTAWPFWVVSGVCGLLLAVHLGFRINHTGLREGLDAIALGLIAVGLSPWIARVLESFKFGGVEFRFVKQQIERQGQELSILKFVMVHFITQHEFAHLKKLAVNESFVIDIAHYPQDFQRELRHLRDLGFIIQHPSKGIRTLYQEPGQHKNLHDYFRITESGRKYLEIRRDIEEFEHGFESRAIS